MGSLSDIVKQELSKKFNNNEYSCFIYTKNEKPILGDKSKIIECMNEVFDEDNFIEGRIFNENNELRIYFDGEKFKVINRDKQNILEDKKITRKYLINKKFEENYEYIEIIEYLKKDDDGEYRIIATCLDKLIKKGESDEKK